MANQSQQKLREIQQKRDNFNTYGHDYKDPCKQVYHLYSIF